MFLGSPIYIKKAALMNQKNPVTIPNHNHLKVIIGLGNPGKQYYYQRHSIGFRILDELAKKHNLCWHTKGESEQTELSRIPKQTDPTSVTQPVNQQANKILLIKPQTFMNNSGAIMPSLLKQGIEAGQILVIHDELEIPFGKITARIGGSHRGHNGLRSIIERCGPEFVRLRVGIGRPKDQKDVGSYVLSPFDEPQEEIDTLIERSIVLIEQAILI